MRKRLIGLGLAVILVFSSASTALADTKNIIGVTDVKELPERSYYCDQAYDGLVGFSRNGTLGKGYVDSNFNTVLEPFELWNNTSIYTQGNFNGGVAPIGLPSNQNSLTILNWYLSDTQGKQVASLGLLCDLRAIPKGQDPNGVLYFGVAFYQGMASATTYKVNGELTCKKYYYADYPELKGANRLGQLVNGRINVYNSSVKAVKNKGAINQETWNEYTPHGTFDLLGNYYSDTPQISQADKYRDDSCNPQLLSNDAKKFTNTGAYFELQGDKYVLKDATGSVKLELRGGQYTIDCFQIVNDDTFIGRPYGSTSESPWHLYKIQYAE